HQLDGPGPNMRAALVRRTATRPQSTWRHHPASQYPRLCLQQSPTVSRQWRLQSTTYNHFVECATNDDALPDAATAAATSSTTSSTTNPFRLAVKDNIATIDLPTQC